MRQRAIRTGTVMSPATRRPRTPPRPRRRYGPPAGAGAPAQGTYGGGSADGFVGKFDPTSGTFDFLTYFGGTLEDFAVDLDIDSSGNVYVIGRTFGSVTTTSGAFDETTDGATMIDAFV